LEQNNAESASVIDIEVAKHYYSELKLLADSVNQTDFTDYLSIILKMPEVLVQKESEMNEEELSLVLEGVANATNAVNEFRIDEGKVLEKDIALRIRNILKLLTEVESFEKPRIANIKERIAGNINKFIQDPETDKNRLEQEMIYYIEKLDITEEKNKATKIIVIIFLKI